MSNPSNPNENGRLPQWGVGLIAVILVVFGFYLAFTKSIPLISGDGYQLKAVFNDAQNIRANSPVRIAGVDVGKVTDVEHLTDGNGNGLDGAVVTMSLKDDALPIREDATMQLRPRLFLEGNLFVDLQPGSPAGEELDSGDVVPMEQTASSVQFDQVLTSLQAPVRDSLQVFLAEFGEALCGKPSEQSDEGCVPGSGADGFRELLRTSPAAFGSTAQVNEALLGTEPGDLAGFIRNLGTTVEALDRNEEQLKDLVTNFRIVTGSFAAERDALQEGITELPEVLRVGRPALEKLNDDFPALRAFAREALPGVEAADRALDDANPFIRQLRALSSKPELRGLVKDLRPTIPELAALARGTVPFFEETRALSSCFNNTVIPWSELDVPAANFPAEQVYKETGYGIAGVAGESRSGDANGQALRVLGGGGTLTLSFPQVNPDGSGEQNVAGMIPFELLGAQPAKQTAAKTPFRPDVPCETQEVPDLNTGTPPDPPETRFGGSPEEAIPDDVEAAGERYSEIYGELLKAEELERAGDVEEANAIRKSLRDDLRSFQKNDLADYEQALADFTGVNLGGGN
jgi:phospholipid/cholesterol/gamma-HCH transport system substrate-binding protein